MSSGSRSFRKLFVGGFSNNPPTTIGKWLNKNYSTNKSPNKKVTTIPYESIKEYHSSLKLPLLRVLYKKKFPNKPSSGKGITKKFLIEQLEESDKEVMQPPYEYVKKYLKSIELSLPIVTVSRMETLPNNTIKKRSPNIDRTGEGKLFIYLPRIYFLLIILILVYESY